MNQKELNSLNKILQGEHMAIEAFNTYIDKLENSDDKKVFQEVQNQHRNNMSSIANFIQEAGHKPNEKLGVKGTFGEIMVNMQIRNGVERNRIIDKAIQGENNGIHMAEKAVRGTLDDSSRSLIGGILSQDRISLDKLQGLR